MEMWVSRTPMMRKRTLRNGRPTTATVRFCVQGTDGEANPSWNELRGELDVEVPGGGTRMLRGLFNGHKKMAPYVLPGTRLPVVLHADNDDKLVIDWDRWEADGGLAAAKAQTTPAQAVNANSDAQSAGAVDDATSMVSTSGGVPASGGWQEQTIAAWRAALASGHMSQAEFDAAMDDLRRASGG